MTLTPPVTSPSSSTSTAARHPRRRPEPDRRHRPPRRATSGRGVGLRVAGPGPVGGGAGATGDAARPFSTHRAQRRRQRHGDEVWVKDHQRRLGQFCERLAEAVHRPADAVAEDLVGRFLDADEARRATGSSTRGVAPTPRYRPDRPSAFAGSPSHASPRRPDPQVGWSRCRGGARGLLGDGSMPGIVASSAARSSAPSSNAAGVWAARRPGTAATRLASTRAPPAMATIDRVGTTGLGTAYLTGEEVPQEASEHDPEGHPDDEPDHDGDARLPGDARRQLATGEPQGPSMASPRRRRRTDAMKRSARAQSPHPWPARPEDQRGGTHLDGVDDLGRSLHGKHRGPCSWRAATAPPRRGRATVAPGRVHARPEPHEDGVRPRGGLVELVAHGCRDESVRDDGTRPHRRVPGDTPDPERRHGGRAHDPKACRGGVSVPDGDRGPHHLVDLRQGARTEDDLGRPVEAVAAQHGRGHRRPRRAAQDGHGAAVDLQIAEAAPRRCRYLPVVGQKGRRWAAGMSPAPPPPLSA